LRRSQATGFSQPDWRRAGGLLDDPDPVTKAWAFLVHCRQSLSARKQEFATISTGRTRRPMCEQVSAWLTAVEGLPAVHDRLKRVTVLNEPAVDVIERYDDEDTTFYCDPTYVHSTRTAKDVYGRFEMTDDDHRQLLGVLKGCRGRVLISGYPSELY